MTTELQRYLELEKEKLALAAAIEQIEDRMDLVWFEISIADREWLNARTESAQEE